ncbi:MAG: MFS transporter [Nocardioidaceae bacterium]
MSYLGGLRRLLAERWFRRLFAVRVTGQLGDGVFQVALASYVLFSPERQPDAASIAAALAAVLLPFSVLGPFAGVFLDRWNRRQILAVGNLVRAVPVVLTALAVAVQLPPRLIFAVVVVAISVNRFLLAGLSAALPRVVERDELVLANSVSPTSGTIAFMCGLGAGSGLRRVPMGLDPDVAVILVAAALYVAAAALALRIPRPLLGPDGAATEVSVRQDVGLVAAGLVHGVRHLRERHLAAAAIAVIGAHRFCYGLSVVATILLYRNYFNDPADAEAGLAGLSLAALAAAAGFFLAAVLTPVMTARFSAQGWMVSLLAVAAACQAVPGALFTERAILVAAFVLGLAGQGVKICVDSLVQAHVDDQFRGRVFAIYDVTFNVAFVVAAAVGAVVIPANGKSYAVLAAIAAGYAATALAFSLVDTTEPVDLPRRLGLTPQELTRQRTKPDGSTHQA